MRDASIWQKLLWQHERVPENGNDAYVLSGKLPKFERFCDYKQEVSQLLVNEILVFSRHIGLLLII